MNEHKMREALVRVRELLTNMQPHIEQACYPGKAAFIDNYVDPCLETIAKAIDQQQVIAPIEQRILALRNQLASDIIRTDGRWGIHGHSCVDDDYFQALEYVVTRMDEALAQQPDIAPLSQGVEIQEQVLTDAEIQKCAEPDWPQGLDPCLSQMIAFAHRVIAAHEAKKRNM